MKKRYTEVKKESKRLVQKRGLGTRKSSRKTRPTQNGYIISKQQSATSAIRVLADFTDTIKNKPKDIPKIHAWLEVKVCPIHKRALE